MMRLLKSPAVRVAIAFACAVTVTTTVVFALVYLQFYTSNVASVRSVLQNEVHGALEISAERLERQLELRLTQDLRHLDYVGLYDETGRLMFGNVKPGIDIPADGTARIIRTPSPQQGTRQSGDAIFVAQKRPDGGTLVLGRSLVYVDELEAAMLHGFVVAIFPVICLALLGGAVVSLRASRRLSTIQHAINRVMLGDLHVRLPARGTPDDIDELVRAVNAMLDEIVRLLNQLKSVGDNIAHDLRAPLAVMRARLERGLAGTSEETLRRLAAEALCDLERAMTTVTALLRISELESGLRRSAFDEVDLALVARDAVELYEPLAEAKAVSMTLAAPAPLFVTGDGDLLREALVNLIDNAIKFTPHGGAVAVECGASGTLLRVSDNGPGIAAAERDKIFKRFYRAAGTLDAAGNGLGLSMATTIVELHGFGLRIRDNAPGAIFEIVRGAQSPAEAPGPEKSEPRRKARAAQLHCDRLVALGEEKAAIRAASG